MENKNNITLENLSPAEQQLILLQREKAEIEAKEKAQQLQIKTEKEIAAKKVEMAKFLADWQQQNNKAHSYLGDLQDIDPRFQLVTKERTQIFEVYHNDDRESGYAKIVDWTEEVKFLDLSIMHTALERKIILIREHRVSDSRYSSRTTNHGYKMTFDEYGGRYTKDPKNMASKFTEILEQKARELREKNTAATAQEMADAKLKELYPTATIEHKSERIYPNNYGGSRRYDQKPYDSTWFNVVFPNGYGIKVAYGVHNNELWLRKDGTFAPNFEGESNQLLDPKNKGVQNFITALQNISK